MTPMELYFASRWGCYALGYCFHVGNDQDSIFIICSNGMKNIEFVFYSYHIFIAYTSISEWGPVVMYGFDCFFFLYRLRRIFAEMILWLEDTPSKEEYASQFPALFIHSLFMSMCATFNDNPYTIILFWQSHQCSWWIGYHYHLQWAIFSCSTLFQNISF